MNKQTLAIWGIANGYYTHKTVINQKFDVVSLVDANPEKQGMIVDGLMIKSPSTLKDTSFDYVLVLPISLDGYKIRKELNAMGIPDEKMRFIDTGGVSPFGIDPLFFADDLTEEDRQRLFAENVERVVFEINSKCNRECWFCTNSVVDRHSHNIDMEDDVFYKIISELKLIDYDADICFSFFNEPLCSPKLFERLRYIRKNLPKALLYLFTNGDFLEKEHLQIFSDIGLNLLLIDIYQDDKDKDYDHDDAQLETDKMLTKLGFDIDYDKSLPNVDFIRKFNDMTLRFIAKNFRNVAANRAESLPEDLPIPKIEGHPRLCVCRFMSYHIDYNGDVWPCPNYHPNFEPHKKYRLGNVKNETIFELYCGKNFADYYEQHMFHRENLPCRSCILNFYSVVTNIFDRPFRDRPVYRRKYRTTFAKD